MYKSVNSMLLVSSMTSSRAKSFVLSVHVKKSVPKALC